MIKRSIIKVSGVDAKIFLGNLITQDINKVLQYPCYGCLLNKKGRYNFDFFIISISDYFLIDIIDQDAEKFITSLNYYKLLSQVYFEILQDFKIYIAKEGIDDFFKEDYIVFQDTRLKCLGKRIVTNRYLENIDVYSEEEYRDYRYSLAVPEGDDFIFDKSIPIEYGMFELNAIASNKGCYLGQEFTNSSKNKMMIRKRLLLCRFKKQVAKGDILYAKDIEVGKVINFYQNQALVLFKIQFLDQEITLNDEKIEIIKPSWIEIFSLD